MFRQVIAITTASTEKVGRALTAASVRRKPFFDWYRIFLQEWSPVGSLGRKPSCTSITHMLRSEASSLVFSPCCEDPSIHHGQHRLGVRQRSAAGCGRPELCEVLPTHIHPASVGDRCHAFERWGKQGTDSRRTQQQKCRRCHVMA